MVLAFLFNHLDTGSMTASYSWAGRASAAGDRALPVLQLPPPLSSAGSVTTTTTTNIEGVATAKGC